MSLNKNKKKLLREKLNSRELKEVRELIAERRRWNSTLAKAWKVGAAKSGKKKEFVPGRRNA